MCFVRKTAEDRDALGMDVPGLGDADLGATKNAVDLDGGFIALDLCVAQVELDAAEDGCGSSTFEILALHTAFAAAKDGDGVEHVGGIGGAARREGTLQCAPHEEHANRNNRQRPHIGEVETDNSKLVELKEGADGDENHAPGAGRGSEEVSD